MRLSRNHKPPHINALNTIGKTVLDKGITAPAVQKLGLPRLELTRNPRS
jgi:hypothetical protein